MSHEAHHDQQEQSEELQQQQRQQGDVWHLLLGGLWTPLDQAVVCKLMCCSQDMADLVHEKCAGGLLMLRAMSAALPHFATAWVALPCTV
jgi:hypothetical protein